MFNLCLILLIIALSLFIIGLYHFFSKVILCKKIILYMKSDTIKIGFYKPLILLWQYSGKYPYQSLAL